MPEAPASMLFSQPVAPSPVDTIMPLDLVFRLAALPYAVSGGYMEKVLGNVLL